MAISIAENPSYSEVQELAGDPKHYELTIYNRMVVATVTRFHFVVDWWIYNHFRHTNLNSSTSAKVIFGLDVEWRPNLNTNEERNPIATIQIFNKRCCLIFQIFRCCCIPKSLYKLLKNKKYTFVGKGIESDAEKLMEDYDLKVSRVVDVGDLAAEVFDEKKFRKMRLKGLVRELMGEDMEKPMCVSLSKWDAKRLSLSQVKYACVDAYYSYKLGKWLLEY